MKRATLLDARMYGIPAALGACAGDNDEFLRTINEAMQRLIIDEAQPDEGWWGTWARIAFDVSREDPYFTTGRDVSRVTAMDVCKQPVVLRNQFWEYLEFGNGLRPTNCCESALCEDLTGFDRGLAITFKDIKPPNKKIRVFATDETDYGKRTLISYKDPFGNIIHSQDGFSRVMGEFLSFTSPFATTTSDVAELLGIQKDETNGAIQFHEVDTVTGEMRLILTMEPTETVAGYRRYFVNGLPTSCCATETIQVSALCKLDFVPVAVDTDYLIIQNLAALKEECQGIRLSDMDSPNAKRMGQAHHVAALRLLFGELDHFVGKERVSVQVPLWNGARLRRQPI